MKINPLLQEQHWNQTLPPVDVDLLLALEDGTVWKVRRESWLQGYDQDPGYKCKTTGHPVPVNMVIGWRYA